MFAVVAQPPHRAGGTACARFATADLYTRVWRMADNGSERIGGRSRLKWGNAFTRGRAARPASRAGRTVGSPTRGLTARGLGGQGLAMGGHGRTGGGEEAADDLELLGGELVHHGGAALLDGPKNSSANARPPGE